MSGYFTYDVCKFVDLRYAFAAARRMNAAGFTCDFVRIHPPHDPVVKLCFEIPSSVFAREAHDAAYVALNDAWGVALAGATRDEAEAERCMAL